MTSHYKDLQERAHQMEMSEHTDKAKARSLRAVIASGFMAALGVGLVSFVLPLASMDARVSGGWLGSGFAGFFVARLLAGPLGGWWADKVSPRSPLLFATALGAMAPLLYIVNPSISSLYFIQFVLGVVAGMVRPVGLAVLGGNSDAGASSKWFRYHVLAFNIALFLGPILGGLLFWNRSVQLVLVGLALCMVFANCIIFSCVSARIRSRRRGDTPNSKAAANMSMGALLMAIFGRAFGIGVMVAFYPVLLSMRLGVSGLGAGMLFALPGLVTCVGLPLGPWMRKRTGVDPVVAGMALSGVGLVLAGVSTESWHFVGAGFVMGLGSAMSIAEAMQLASWTSADQGRVFGRTHLATGSGLVVGPLVGGLLVQWTGNLSTPFVLAGLFGWLCLLSWDRYDGWDWPQHRRFGTWLLSKAFPAMFMVAAMFATVHYHNEKKQGSATLYRYSEMAMGTMVNLTLEADSQLAADNGARKVMTFIRTVQSDLDYRNPTGSVGQINNAAGKHYVEPSVRAYELIKRAVGFARKTGGVFDPTIGALTTSPLYYVLDETIAREKSDLVNYRFVRFDEEGRRVRLHRRGMALDLGGIAKGSIIDAAVKLLRTMNIRAGIVEAGGDFYCFGDRDWTVGIRHPRNEEVYGTVSVREKGVCGSGDYEQFVSYEDEGETTLKHHIIDPKNMEPAGESAGVTVIAESAELADALATTLFIMGSDQGRRFVERTYPDASALWFAPNLTVTATTGFPQ